MSIEEMFLAFEQLEVGALARRLEDSVGELDFSARQTVEVLAAAALAAAGMESGPVLAECSRLLAQRMTTLSAESEGVVTGIRDALGILVAADQEVGRDVAAAGK